MPLLMIGWFSVWVESKSVTLECKVIEGSCLLDILQTVDVLLLLMR